MSLPALQQSGYTLDDWQTWEGRWELIHGVAYDMTPAPSFEHQDLASKLHLAMGNALAEKNRRSGETCKVVFAPLDVYLDDSVVQPDLVVICDPAKITRRGIEGAPDLVVEILSPRTAIKDLNRKWWLYESAGIPEYLIVDPEEKVGRLLRLVNGLYVEAARVRFGAALPLLNGTLPVVF